MYQPEFVDYDHAVLIFILSYYSMKIWILYCIVFKLLPGYPLCTVVHEVTLAKASRLHSILQLMSVFWLRQFSKIRPLHAQQLWEYSHLHVNQRILHAACGKSFMMLCVSIKISCAVQGTEHSFFNFMLSCFVFLALLHHVLMPLLAKEMANRGMRLATHSCTTAINQLWKKPWQLQQKCVFWSSLQCHILSGAVAAFMPSL